MSEAAAPYPQPDTSTLEDAGERLADAVASCAAEIARCRAELARQRLEDAPDPVALVGLGNRIADAEYVILAAAQEWRDAALAPWLALMKASRQMAAEGAPGRPALRVLPPA